MQMVTIYYLCPNFCHLSLDSRGLLAGQLSDFLRKLVCLSVQFSGFLFQQFRPLRDKLIEHPRVFFDEARQLVVGTFSELVQSLDDIENFELQRLINGAQLMDFLFLAEVQAYPAFSHDSEWLTWSNRYQLISARKSGPTQRAPCRSVSWSPAYILGRVGQ